MMEDAVRSIRGTRWDQLCAVLEEVDADRVIDASRIIERQKTLGVSDSTLFQLIQLRHQDAKSPVVSAAVHLYVLKDSWLLWLRRTEECLRRHRTGHHGSNARRDATSAGTAAAKNVHLDLREFWERDDGSLDAFRDGALLSVLVEESLSYTDAFVSLAAVHKTTAQQLSQLEYSFLFPSLQPSSDSNSGSFPSPRDRQSNAPTTRTSSEIQSPLSPVSVVKTARSRRTSHRRPVHAQLKQQEDTMRRAVCSLTRLNDLCATFLSWKECGGSSTELFLPIKSLEHAMTATVKDDLVLLERLHWLSLALHERVHDETVVPPPPTVSFLLYPQFQAPTSTLQPDEDSDIAVLVATQFTFFPHSHQLEILSPSPRKVSIRHPKAVIVQYDCVLVEKEAYVYDRPHRLFRPFWELMKQLLLLLEEKPWFFEMTPAQLALEQALLGGPPVTETEYTSSHRGTKPVSSLRRESEGRDDRSCATFELTVRSSTVTLARAPAVGETTAHDGEKKVPVPMTVVPVSTVQRRRQKSALVPAPALATSASGTQVQPPQPSACKGDIEALAHNSHTSASSQPVSACGRQSGSDSGDDLVGMASDAAFDAASALESPQCVDAAKLQGPAFDHPVTEAVARPEIHESSTPRRGTGCDDEGRKQPHHSITKTYFSEVGHRQQLNFSAEVLQECDQNNFAVTEHHFRVSGKPIGKGAFGAVYRALDLETGLTVAVKQSRYTLKGAAEDNVNWNELQLLSVLPHHPNVITFHGASKELETKQLLLVMEYASGGSILTMYNDFWPMPESLFFRHAREMALGLKHLHDHGVIHGDVKPENVLTRSNGSVALTDFGCSSVCGTAEGAGAFAAMMSLGGGMSNSLSGTPVYMAPEVILGAVDTKSDVWAFACTLVQLWLWELPYSDGHGVDVDNVVPLLFYIGSQEVVPYSDSQIELTPRWLQKIAARAFVRSVEDRCNMADILTILTSYS